MTNNIVSRRLILQAGAASAAVASLPAWAKVGAQPDVLILGAGMAGLHAARLLEREGVSVQVIEGSGRIGGRCWTARNAPGRPELGAAQIGAAYGRVRANASELGIALVDPPHGALGETSVFDVAVSIGGAPPTRDWAASPMNRLAPEEKSLTPLKLYMHYLLKNDPLVELEDWRKPDFAAIDRMSLEQYLRSQGASTEAMRLLQIAVPGWKLEDASALDALRKNHYFAWAARRGPVQNVRDGMDALTTAMARSLRSPVALRKIVSHIVAKPHEVRVRCRDGSQYRARAAICTIPLSVLKDIRVTGDVPDGQRLAWSRQRYYKTLFVHLKVKSPFWEKDGLPPTMWTDGPFEIFAYQPSAVSAIGNLFAGINGAATEPLDHLSDRALGDRVIRELVKLRPAAAGQVDLSFVHNWSTYPFSKGHIAYYGPGDLGRYAGIVGQPVGALAFAGEHLCRVQAGIEGACESAESGALSVLENLSQS